MIADNKLLFERGFYSIKKWRYFENVYKNWMGKNRGAYTACKSFPA